MSKYEILKNVLDKLILEAPDNYSKYRSCFDDPKKLDKARSLAYIHLFLKANFNLSDFNDRESFIVDGPYDGGIDAYYIDKENRVIYFIQSKFRTTEDNFKNKAIDVNELSKMDSLRISDGETVNEIGDPYNDKIKNMQHNITSLEDLTRYKYKVIILANIDHKLKPTALKRLVENLEYEVFDYKSAYNNLLFPLLQGLSHQADTIVVKINLDGKNSSNMSYSVTIDELEIEVQVFFVPTIEIAKVMHVYQNSILKWNPRAFIGMSTSDNDKPNMVNDKIRNSILKSDSNEFSLFNNGITIISDDTYFQTRTGKRGEAQLQLSNPQIINGGQTANTLAHIYENPKIDNSVFEGKEVLTKVISISENTDSVRNNKVDVIESLSMATNLQSVVTESDRKSNDPIQTSFQKYAFDEFGYLYNRKEGEFYDSIDKGYFDKKYLIPRNILIRIANVVVGKISSARRSGGETLFKDASFQKVFNENTDFKKLMYGYFVHQYLVNIELKSKKEKENFYPEKYGNGIRYGKYAIVGAALKFYKDSFKPDELNDMAIKMTKNVLTQWKKFEQEVALYDDNKQYFYEDDEKQVTYNYDGYYKGNTIDEHIRNYSFIKPIEDN